MTFFYDFLQFSCSQPFKFYFWQILLPPLFGHNYESLLWNFATAHNIFCFWRVWLLLFFQDSNGLPANINIHQTNTICDRISNSFVQKSPLRISRRRKLWNSPYRPVVSLSFMIICEIQAIMVLRWLLYFQSLRWIFIKIRIPVCF